MLVDLLVLSAAGGLFTVPLYALLQQRSQPEARSRIIAGNNVVNAVAMTVGALVAAALLSRGMTMAELFALCGWGTVPVAILAAWRSIALSAINAAATGTCLALTSPCSHRSAR